ncbi:MAG: thioether cross-link-forming SCIFF peptide maturase [Provencibacterium sp.]|nr:thioether cross-link-forming SCIFF peptide maturase [Provencibacterium sp.]
MIHAYSLGGYNIVLDVHSGAVHLFDEIGMRLIEQITPPMQPECPAETLAALKDRFSGEEIAETWQELYQLQQEGQLFSEDDYARFADKMVPSPIKAMCLHVAHDCNLRCEYCFAGTGSYSGRRSVMPVETGKKAIDYLIAHSQGRHNLEVDFFGGEPLLNFPLIKEVVAYARSLEKEHNKCFRFTVTTNGVLLDDEKIDFINREMYNVVLSVDGRPQVNDRIRHRVDGSGCYEQIMPKFKELVRRRGDGQYYIRGTFTRYNLDFSEDVLHFYREGFDQISIEPVVAPQSAPYSLTEEHLPLIYEEYERLAQKMIEYRRAGKRFNFFHFMLDLDQGPCAIKRLRGCGCGNEYVAITPDGEVYPCHQFVGMEDYRMGDIFENTIDWNMKADFAKSTVYDKPECRECWAKFYCSGGCNANNLQYGGSIRTPARLSCALEKKRLECAIMLKCSMLDDPT